MRNLIARIIDVEWFLPNRHYRDQTTLLCRYLFCRNLFSRAAYFISMYIRVSSTGSSTIDSCLPLCYNANHPFGISQTLQMIVYNYRFIFFAYNWWEMLPMLWTYMQKKREGELIQASVLFFLYGIMWIEKGPMMRCYTATKVIIITSRRYWES